MYDHRSLLYIALLGSFLCVMACNEDSKQAKNRFLAAPGSLDEAVQKKVIEKIDFARHHSGKFDDSLTLSLYPVVSNYYDSIDHAPVWSSMGKFKGSFYNLITYLEGAAGDGLFKEDYHFSNLFSLQKALETDSLKRLEAGYWAAADLLSTDAFIHLLQDLKQGRLQHDSLGWGKKSSAHQVYFSENLDRLKRGESIDTILKSVQPSIKGYWALKSEIGNFINTMDKRKYTYLSYPYKAGNSKDSADFVKKLVIRLGESIPLEKNTATDSAQLVKAVKLYQQHVKLKVDGKISASLVNEMNNSDLEKFYRIAITLDRYKQLPQKMPEKYILVNLPAYDLQVWDSDTLVFSSRIICGKPATSTPLITSAISDIVVFPTWTVPASIIQKEMLPALKKNAGYLARKGLGLFNNRDEPVDPFKVNWANYTKGIPYKIRQGSGDGNALGVIKFNFDNPFSVYLHDTNQRYLFKKAKRALSHGCVRVQEWEKLAFYLIRNDSMEVGRTDTLSYNTDSVGSWIAKKEKHRIDIKNKIPLFIRYFGCEGNNGTIRFFEDIYAEDKMARDNYFQQKNDSLK